MKKRTTVTDTLEAALLELDRISKTELFKKLFGDSRNRIENKLRALFNYCDNSADAPEDEEYCVIPIYRDDIDKVFGCFRIQSEKLLSVLTVELLNQAMANYKNVPDEQQIKDSQSFAKRVLRGTSIDTPEGLAAYLIQEIAHYIHELSSLANFYRLKSNLKKDPGDYPSACLNSFAINIVNEIRHFAYLLSTSRVSSPLSRDCREHLNKAFCIAFRTIDKIHVTPQSKIACEKYRVMRDLYDWRESGWKKKIIRAAAEFIEELRKIHYSFAKVESRLDFFEDEQPIPARVVEVDKSAGKSLRTAMQDPGGRPKKTAGGAEVPTQAEMAVAFGEPCNEDMVANWEARAAGKRRGANPPDAIYKGERIVYSAELRLNPTPDNKNRLAALITEFQSRHRFKAAVGEKKKTIHCRSEESLYQARVKHGA